MRSLSYLALSLAASLSLAACNSTSTSSSAPGTGGFVSADPRFKAHPEAMTGSQADSFVQLKEQKHLYVFGSDDDDEEQESAQGAPESAGTAQDTASAAEQPSAPAAEQSAASGAGNSAKAAPSAEATAAGFVSAEPRFKEHPELMTGQKKPEPVKAAPSEEEQAKAAAKRAAEQKKQELEDKVARAAESSPSGFVSSDPRFRFHPELMTGQAERDSPAGARDRLNEARVRAGLEPLPDEPDYDATSKIPASKDPLWQLKQEQQSKQSK